MFLPGSVAYGYLLEIRLSVRQSLFGTERVDGRRRESNPELRCDVRCLASERTSQMVLHPRPRQDPSAHTLNDFGSMWMREVL